MNLKTLNTFLTSAFLETFLFSLLLVLLPTQLGKHFWPAWSYIYSLRIDYLAVTIYFWDVLVYILWLVFLIKKPQISWGMSGGLGLLMVLGVVSMINSGSWGVGVSRLVNVVPAGLFGIYIASKESDFVKEKMIRFLQIGLVFSSLLALLQILLGRTLGLWFLGERSFDLSTPGIATFNWYGQVFLRPYATFPHPNVLAAFLLVTTLILFFLSRRLSFQQLGVYFLAGLSLISSFSRSVLLIYASILGFLLRRQFVYLLIGIIFLAPLLYVRFESAFNFDSLSLIRREELTESALTLSKLNPLFGIGLNNYIPTAVSTAFLSGTNRFLQPVHNIFLLTLVETGWLGLVGFLIVLISPLVVKRNIFLLLRSQVLTLLLVIIFLGMIDHYFLTLPQGQRLLFIVLGLSWCKKDS